MNVANLLNLTNSEMGILLLMGGVALSFFVQRRYLKRIVALSEGALAPAREDALPAAAGEPLLLRPDQISRWLEESEAICQQFSRNIEEKKETARNLIAQLDERIGRLQALQKAVTGHEVQELPPIDPERADLQDQISEMARAGCDPSDIARRLGRPQGEIQLALDLEKYRQTVAGQHPGSLP